MAITKALSVDATDQVSFIDSINQRLAEASDPFERRVLHIYKAVAPPLARAMKEQHADTLRPSEVCDLISSLLHSLLDLMSVESGPRVPREARAILQVLATRNLMQHVLDEANASVKGTH